MPKIECGANEMVKYSSMLAAFQKIKTKESSTKQIF